mgnify:CR=1 FL=1
MPVYMYLHFCRLSKAINTWIHTYLKETNKFAWIIQRYKYKCRTFLQTENSICTCIIHNLKRNTDPHLRIHALYRYIYKSIYVETHVQNQWNSISLWAWYPSHPRDDHPADFPSFYIYKSIHSYIKNTELHVFMYTPTYVDTDIDKLVSMYKLFSVLRKRFKLYNPDKDPL